jgi:HPt (histidine-containing phosphotransfer) domain-containing protein
VEKLAALPADSSVLAHTLKGSARAIGAFAVADAAARLETAMARGFDTTAALADIGEAVVEARAEIEAVLRRS